LAVLYWFDWDHEFPEMVEGNGRDIKSGDLRRMSLGTHDPNQTNITPPNSCLVSTSLLIFSESIVHRAGTWSG
jgi:hypothetical protein